MTAPEETEDRLHPDAERELEAIDRALAGEPVDPDLADLAALAADLRAERPEPEQRWCAELDTRAGAGFGARSPLERMRRRLRDLPRHRLLAPAGAMAALLVVAVGVTVATRDDQGGLDTPTSAIEPAPRDRAGGETLDPSNAAAEGQATAPATAEEGTVEQSTDAVVPPVGAGRGGGIAPGTEKRRQDRSAMLALKTSTERVREVSDEAIQITESAGGVVLSSRLSERDMEATAELQLSIPTRELDPTLDQLTDLATVESLNEAAVDVTRPFVSARDRLRDARAERSELLEALGNASSDQEVKALRRQLRDARREISRAKAAFDNVARRARNSDVRLTVTGTPDGDEDGSWSLGDAADDALGALETVGGVLLIALAILVPPALLIALALAVAARIRRQRRERALDE